MKKILLLACMALLAGIIGYSILNLSEKAKQPEVAIQEVPALSGKPEVIEVQEKRTISIDEEIPMNLPEEKMQSMIHAMSHQKIEAKEKWSSLPLTTERVNRLLEVARTKQGAYKYGLVYMDILSRWAEKDFNSIDEDHNRIWEMQGGTVGEAKGILSAEEEKQFIKKHFNIE